MAICYVVLLPYLYIAKPLYAYHFSKYKKNEQNISMTTVYHMRTYYSSFAFLFAGYLCDGSWMKDWLMCQACLSILHHAKFFEEYDGKHAVKWLDRACAHFIFLRTCKDAVTITASVYHAELWFLIWTYYGCMMYIVLMYYGYLRKKNHELLHMTIHFAGAIGCVALHRLGIGTTTE